MLDAIWRFAFPNLTKAIEENDLKLTDQQVKRVPCDFRRMPFTWRTEVPMRSATAAQIRIITALSSESEWSPYSAGAAA